jgi:hypothetical protein
MTRRCVEEKETDDGCHAPFSLLEEAFTSSLQAAPAENEAGSNK